VHGLKLGVARKLQFSASVDLKFQFRLNFSEMKGFLVPNFAFLDENFRRKKISDNFPTAQNLGEDSCSLPPHPRSHHATGHIHPHCITASISFHALKSSGTRLCAACSTGRARRFYAAFWSRFMTDRRYHGQTRCSIRHGDQLKTPSIALEMLISAQFTILRFP